MLPTSAIQKKLTSMIYSQNIESSPFLKPPGLGALFYCIGNYKSIFVWITAYGCLNPAPAPSPSRRFGPANEVKERLHCQALQRLSGLNKALALFVLALNHTKIN
jgi:hypothetical protein